MAASHPSPPRQRQPLPSQVRTLSPAQLALGIVGLLLATIGQCLWLFGHPYLGWSVSGVGGVAIGLAFLWVAIKGLPGRRRL